jgi:CRP/FNR family transcriptional regulator, cyclic AMP receptor protein
MSEVSTAFVADPELLAELEKRARPIDLGENRVLFRQGDVPIGVFIVRKGTATLTDRVDGQEVLRALAGPGSLLGVPAVIGAKPYSLTAEAMKDAEVSLLTFEYFVHLMHTEPNLAFLVLQVLAEEVRFAREAMAIV